MSRLTKRVRSDVSPMILKLLNLEEVPDECVEVIGTDSKTCDEVCEENQCNSCVLSAVFEKLAHYEDLEEQGRLIEQKYGYWKLEEEPNGKPYCLHCSVCDDDFHHIGITTAYNYCPNCGAKMLAELGGKE